MTRGLLFIGRIITSIIRLAVILIALLLCLIVLTAYWQHDFTYEYYPFLLFGLMLIFPFRLLNLYWLKIYFYTLFSSTVLTISFNALAATFDSLEFFEMISVGLLLNVLIVYLYVQHRVDKSYSNPFFSAKTVGLTVGISTALVGLFAAGVIYLYYDDNSPDARLRFPGQIPYKEVSGNYGNFPTYKLSSFSAHEISNYLGISLSLLQNTADTVTIYEHSVPILEVDYTKESVNRLQANSMVLPIPASGQELWYAQDSDGQWRVVEKDIIDTLQSQMIMRAQPVRCILGTQDEWVRCFGLDIYKRVELPDKVLPVVNRLRIPWQLELEDISGNRSVLTKRINVWY
jgi:hypothetical protein